jgi:hypothetical protein
MICTAIPLSIVRERDVPHNNNIDNTITIGTNTIYAKERFMNIAHPNSSSLSGRDENELLPETFVPTNKDVICGRARENFHHGK